MRLFCYNNIMKLLKLKKDKNSFINDVNNFVEDYLPKFDDKIIKAYNQPKQVEDLTDEQLHCLIDACDPRLYEDVTDSELRGIYKNVISAYSMLLNVKTPDLLYEVKSASKLSNGEIEFGRLIDNSKVQIFVPPKEEREDGVLFAPFLHLDIVNAIIHELYHIKANNKIIKDVKNCLIKDGESYKLDVQEFENLPNVDQLLVWQNLALEICGTKFKKYEDYYNFGVEENFVRINTLMQMEKIQDMSNASQLIRDEITKYLNYLLYDEYYNGITDYKIYCEKLNKKIADSLQKVRKNNPLAEQLLNEYNYIQTVSMRGFIDYLDVRIKHIDEQKYSLIEILNNRGIEGIKIKENNSYILNCLYALYYSQKNYKKAEQILSINSRTNDYISAIHNARFAKKLRKQMQQEENQNNVNR